MSEDGLKRPSWTQAEPTERAGFSWPAKGEEPAKAFYFEGMTHPPPAEPAVVPRASLLPPTAQTAAAFQSPRVPEELSAEEEEAQQAPTEIHAAPPPPVEAAPEAEHVPTQAEFDAALASAKDAFAQAVAELATARQRILQQSEADLLDFAVSLAGHFASTGLPTEGEKQRALVREALSYVEGPLDEAMLRVSPLAFELLLEHYEGSRFELEGITVQLRRDEALEGLGCFVEAPEFRIDGTLEGRLQALREALREAHLNQSLEGES